MCLTRAGQRGRAHFLPAPLAIPHDCLPAVQCPWPMRSWRVAGIGHPLSCSTGSLVARATSRQWPRHWCAVVAARQVLTVDARNHGSSPHSPMMTYEAMSLDVQHLLSRLGITKCILVGHSMGGKTAMTLALQRPDLVERLISVDIGPGSTAPVSEFSAYISAMKEVKVPAGLSRSAARQLADDQLQPVVKLPQLRQFLLTNLVEVEGRYVWRVNLEAISRHLADIMNFPLFHKPYPGPALFLGGSDSPYISSRDYPEIQRLFPKAEIQYIKGAGHIVHQDKFEEFITAVLSFLP
ncbi:PREDICTED: protein ABHD11 isoform X1 [Ficedula albicollis]|uniref:sn-1-specific diacylglycerol lipase ABHD11 n=2 Tax=Ficedula albicollis TaxID=59894 RepID=A0A803WFD8_FICAL|nr:PREDICTED: protein ABHD11 isoform X1 [Ficedula albicollis]